MIIKEVVIIVKLVLKNPNKLVGLIELSGFNRSQFAKHIGISISCLSYILNQERNPSPTTARKIAKGIEKTVPDLFLIDMRTNVRGKDD